MKKPEILITICARGGSKGVPGKNIRPFCGKPLIAHTVAQAKNWNQASEIVVSTDSEEIATAAESAGAKVPFLRPDELATDSAEKVSVIRHAWMASEEHFQKHFDVIVDLDVTSPLRTTADLENGWQTYQKTGCDVCFSVVAARKNPYFNMVERSTDGSIGLCKVPEKPFATRQSAPKVWEMNASIYFYSREYLMQNPGSLWEGKAECFEMKPESAFDIDDERDFIVAETLMKLTAGESL